MEKNNTKYLFVFDCSEEGAVFDNITQLKEYINKYYSEYESDHFNIWILGKPITVMKETKINFYLNGKIL